MSEHRYVHSVEKDQVELSRLSLQASIVDPVTIRHLETIGVSEGWRCLEVGAGAGSVAQWLSSRVGSAGRVVATDIDLRFLSRITASNLEIRRHDILRDELEKSHYDLVHCRKVLEHLPDAERALRKMADAVCPGGWLLVEEDDHGSRLSVDVTNPSPTPFGTAAKAILDTYRKSGMLDPYFGRRVRGLVEHLGFVDVAQEGWTCMVRGGDPVAQLEAAGLPAVLAAGLFTKEQYELANHVFQDPTMYYPYMTMFCAWGRKPVEDRVT
jgi:SAM-dependent methyltransferase